MKRLRVYVHSLEVPTVGFVDKEGAMHACAQAQKTAFQGLGQMAGVFGNRYLPDEEKQFLIRVEDLCRNNGVELEIVDVGTMSFFLRLRLKMKGVKTPAACCGEKTFYAVPGEEELKNLYH